MFDRYHFSRRDWCGQGDLRRALCMMEMTVRCGQELYRAITQYSGIEYYADLGNNVAMVVGDHGFYNSKRPRTATKELICIRLKELLKDEFIFDTVTRNPLAIDEDGVIELSSFNIDGVDDSGQTVLVDADNGIIFLLEAGYQYIRLVTTFPCFYRGEKFHARKGAAVIKATHGVMTNRLEHIPEVDFQDDFPDYNGKETKK